MFKKIFLISKALFLFFLVSGFSNKAEFIEYIIDDNNLTYIDNSKLYLNIQAIDRIKKGNKTFILKATEVYIKASEELELKKGWQLRGESGNELMIKEKSITTSAIKVKNAHDIQVKNFHLKMDEYVSAEGKSLIEIDNKQCLNLKIEIVNMKLSNHYSAIWIKRGRNILVDSCSIFDNGHQIYLGFLGDRSRIHKYAVHNVTIKNSEIHDSKTAGEIDGIKTLSNCTGIKILNNLIAANNHDGIDLYPGGVEVLIEGNTIRDNGVNGIQVKMGAKYLPSETGQIRNVQIKGNNIINNKKTGIVCRDTISDYYAKGINIINNKIDSSGTYGILSNLPVRIEDNTLFNNGLVKNYNNSNPPVGYTGIYLLRGRPNDSSFVINNTITDQAPLVGLNSIFWLTLTHAKSFTTIKDNKLIISDKSLKPMLPKKVGIGLVKSNGFYDLQMVETQNQFSGDFSKNTEIEN